MLILLSFLDLFTRERSLTYIISNLCLLWQCLLSNCL